MKMKKIMKPYEQFVANILKAAGTARTDPSAVTGLVQDALKSAGLMPGALASAQRKDAGFVDLNEAPAWARKPAAAEEQAEQQAEPGAAGGFPGFGAGRMPDWAAQFKAFQQGHAMAQNYLGNGYRNGRGGLTKDEAEAA